MHLVRSNLIAFTLISLYWNGAIPIQAEGSMSNELEGIYGHSIIGVKDVSASLSSTIMQSYEQLGEFIKDLSVDTQNKISNLTSDTNPIFQKVRKYVEQELLRMKNKYEDLTFLAENKAGMVINHINDTLIEKTNNMDLWSQKVKAKMAAFNDSYMYNQKCFLIDKFIEDSVDDMYGCCSIAVNPIKSMCALLRESINETIDVVVKIMENVERCILEKESYLKYMIPCLNEAYDSFGYLLTKADSIRSELMDVLPVKIVFTDSCIAFVSETVDNEIVYIENDIEYQLKAYSLGDLK